MFKSVLSGAVATAIVMALVHGASATVLTLAPTNDSFIRQDQADTVQDGDGIVLKGQVGQRRVGVIEFELPDVELLTSLGGEAHLNLFHIRSWAQGMSWEMTVRGKQDSFAAYGVSESTLTWNNRGDLVVDADLLHTVNMAGGDVGGDLDPPQWHNLDITNFFNDNRGETVVFVLRNTDNHPDRGGVIQDKEGSRTAFPPFGPEITYIVPEPATALLLLAVLPLLRRRRGN